MMTCPHSFEAFIRQFIDWLQVALEAQVVEAQVAPEVTKQVD